MLEDLNRGFKFIPSGFSTTEARGKPWLVPTLPVRQINARSCWKNGRHAARETAAHADHFKLTSSLNLFPFQANFKCAANWKSAKRTWGAKRIWAKDQALEMDLFEQGVSARYDNGRMVIDQWIWGCPTFRQPIWHWRSRRDPSAKTLAAWSSFACGLQPMLHQHSVWHKKSMALCQGLRDFMVSTSRGMARCVALSSQLDAWSYGGVIVLRIGALIFLHVQIHSDLCRPWSCTSLWATTFSAHFQWNCHQKGNKR